MKPPGLVILVLSIVLGVIVWAGATHERRPKEINVYDALVSSERGAETMTPLGRDAAYWITLGRDDKPIDHAQYKPKR